MYFLRKRKTLFHNLNIVTQTHKTSCWHSTVFYYIVHVKLLPLASVVSFIGSCFYFSAKARQEYCLWGGCTGTPVRPLPLLICSSSRMLKKRSAHQELTDPGFSPTSGSHVFHHPLHKDKVLKRCSLSLMTMAGVGGVQRVYLKACSSRGGDKVGRELTLLSAKCLHASSHLSLKTIPESFPRR